MAKTALALLSMIVCFAPVRSSISNAAGWNFTVIPPSPSNCPQCAEPSITIGPYPCNDGAGCCLDWWGSAETRYLQECDINGSGFPKCVPIGPGFSYPGALVTSETDAYCWKDGHESVRALRWSFLWYPNTGGGRVVGKFESFGKCQASRKLWVDQKHGAGTAGNGCFATGNTEG
jgi:hypothetical protein